MKILYEQKSNLQMLKDNRLKYFILFPCDLTNENFEKIIAFGF